MKLVDALTDPQRYPNCAALAAHVQRSRGPLGTYGAALSNLITGSHNWPFLNEHEKHAGVMLRQLRNGNASRQPALASHLLERLRNAMGEIDPSLLEGDGSLITKIDHKKFVKALETTFDINVLRWQPVSGAVYVWVDDYANQLLKTELTTHTDPRQDGCAFLDKYDYILLRRGNCSDGQYGHFGDATSIWIFLHMPPTEAPGATHTSDAKKLVQLERAIKEATKPHDQQCEVSPYADDVLEGVTMDLVQGVLEWCQLNDANS